MHDRIVTAWRIVVVALVLGEVFGQAPLLAGAEEQLATPCKAEEPCQGSVREVAGQDTADSGAREPSVLHIASSAGAVVIDDVKYIVTAPLRMDLESGLITAGVVGAVGGVMAFDSNIQKWVQRNQSRTGNDVFDGFRTVGDAALPVNAGLAVAGYFFRKSEEGNKLFQTSLVSIEAQMLAGGITQAGKFAIGRNRPSRDPQGNSYEPFQRFNQSMPSGHATQMFALAAVFSEHYSLPVQMLVYSLAMGVGAERVYHNKHFASDVVAGSAIGYVVGKALALRHTYGDKGLSFLPLDVAGGTGVMLQYRY